ncbi:MAG TPA: thiolase family protein [Acidimicrobiales bacterium]|nr:thiolase family protein [Acidimicrobiales bacterium]
MAASDEDWGWASDYADISGQVAIVGVGESDHSKASGRRTTEIVGQAVERALADAGLVPTDIDGLMYVPLPEQFDAAAFHAYFGTSHDLWISTEGGGMTGAAIAPYAAAAALREGRATHILNTFGVAWATQRSEMVGGPGEAHANDRFKRSLELPFGWFPQPVYFATIARRHMHEYGTTETQLGAIAVACRRHANLTPGAVMHDRTLTIDDYLASPKFVAPFRKEDCCLISDGGGAYIMTTAERAHDRPKPVVEVAGVGLGHSVTGVHWAEQPAFTSTPQVFAAPTAFAMAGLSPAEVDVYTCYDPFTIVTLMQIEDSGFCEKGEGGPFVASHDGQALQFDRGGLPTNTHGGLLSHAYVLGIAHVVEVVRQLRHEAAAQVPGAQVGVYGGYTGPQAATLVLRRAGGR